MRKTLKKAMSVVLSAALVLSLGNVGFSKEASAADGDLTWEGSIEMETDWDAYAVEITETASNGITLAGNDGNNFEIDMTADLSAFTNPYITVTATAASEEGKSFAVCAVDENWKWNPTYAGVNDPETVDDAIPADQTTIEGYLDPAVSDYVITAQGRTLTSIVITEGEGSAAAAAEEVVYFQWDGSWVVNDYVSVEGSLAENELTVVPDGVTAVIKDDLGGIEIWGMDLSGLANPTLTITYTGDVALSSSPNLAIQTEADWSNINMDDATDVDGVYTVSLPADLTDLGMWFNVAVTVTQIKISDAPASDDGTYFTEIYFADSSWGGMDATTQVELNEGSATYTLGADGLALSGVTVFVVDIYDFAPALEAAGCYADLTDMTLTINGEDVAVDMSKVFTGNIEDNNDKWRIEIYNEYGNTSKDSPVDTAAFDSISSLYVTFTLDITAIDFTMNLFANGDFGWDDTLRDTVNVTGYSEYTLAFTSEIDLEDLNANQGAVWVESNLTEEPTGFDVVGKTMTVAGTEYDWSDVIFYQDGDTYRLSVMNTWGDEKANPFAGTVIPVAAGDEITLTFEVVAKVASGVSAADEDAAEDAEDETVALNEYHAYLGFQTAVWNYRDQWASKETMEASVDGYDFDTMAIFNGAATDPSQVVIRNATITENGEYTVSMTGLDLSEDQYFNMLYVSTDIPSTMSGVEVTDAVITLDDTTYEMAVLPVKNDITNGKTDGDFAGYMFMAIDYYDKTNEDLNNVIITDWDDGVPENFTMPQNTISISFKISGVDFAFSDNAGAKKTVNGVTYKVTKSGNAKVVKVKNQKKVTIKNKVKINGTSYKVTSLKKGVFSGKSKVANVTLGKNIKKIPAKAFNKCTNLKKLTVNAKLTSVSKNAFKGCKKTIKVSGKKVAANVKTLKASGYKKFTK